VVQLGNGLLQTMIGRRNDAVFDSGAWFEMPAVGDENRSGRSRPKYEIPSRALLVYHGQRVSVRLLEPADEVDFVGHPDVRRLSYRESEKLEVAYPFVAHADNPIARKPLRLGDAVSRIAGTMRINECEPCRRRRRRLNRIIIWGWWRID
jgi:hypothetical protein